MKKFIFSAIAAIGLLLSPSCSDENEALSGSGNEALVSFSVNLADGIQTKADPTTTTTLGNGRKAKNLVVDVFELNTTTSKYERIDGLRQKYDDAFDNSLTKTVNFNLVKGKTYRLIFWAQAQSVVNPPNSPYKISDLSKITVDYSAEITNDEDRDAFLYVTDPITVSGNFTKSVEMTRPFAQLNYLIDKEEYDAAVLAGMDIKKAKVTVAKVAKTLYPLKNTVADFEENKTFEVTPIPTDFDATPLTGEDHLNLPKAGRSSTSNDMQDYYYLASKYFLVAAGNEAANSALEQATLATTSFKLVNSSDQEIADYEFKVPAVPVRRNYRTNIYGNLITSQGNFTVTIQPGFLENINRPQSSETVDDKSEIAAAIARGATTIVASENFTLSTDNSNPTKITVPQNYTEQTKDVELTFDFSKVAGNTTAIEITYNDEDTGEAPKNVNVVATGKVIINLEDSHVTLNGNTVDNTGTYQEVTASTSSTTLVVPNGVTVEKLIVKAGNVRIEKGGKVTNIERHDEADATIPTYVTIVTGGVLSNIPDDPNIIITYEDATEGKVVLNGVYSFNTVKEAVAYAASKNISDVKLVLAAGEYQEAVSIPNNTTVSIEPASGLEASQVKFNGQLASLGNGVLNVKNITISHNPTIDLTGISQTGKSAIALWGAAVANCENVTFENFANDATAITSWWSTGKGTQINVKNSTFNCDGQRPIRSDANVTVEGCTFTDPYRYAVQMTSKSSTMSAENAVVNFKNNTIYAGSTSTKMVVYGIQLEGETYGCSHLIINGSGNTIDLGSTGKTGTMYYCECGKVDHTSIVWNTTDGTPKHANEHEVSTVDEFVTALTTAGNTKGDQTISITANLDFSDIDWRPVTVQGYTGTGVITINGNNHTISGLKDALFAGGFAGRSGIIINDLTIDGQGVTIEDDTESQGWGYFIKNIDSMPMITLKNCHLKNANVTSTGGARVGGLIGWTSGYNKQNDGPVDTYVYIRNCSVENSKIEAAGSVGAIIGHAGANPATYHFFENCTVTDCTLNSTDDGGWRVGVVVGTANVGEVTISNITESGNTLIQTDKTAPEHSNLYGRFFPQNGSGKLTIDGVEITQ